MNSTPTSVWKKIFLTRKDLPFYSGYTYHFLLRATLVGCFANGAISLMGLMLKKTLEANAWYIALHQTLFFGVFIFGPFWQRYLRGRSTSKAMTAFGLVGYMPILLIGIIGNSTPYFIFASVMTVFANSAFSPMRNSILAHNLADSERGRVVGHAMAYGVVLSSLVSLLCGHLLDVYSSLYRIILPIGSLAGFWGYHIYGQIRLRQFKPEEVVRTARGRREGILTTARKSFGDVFELLKNNPGFRKFERNFFLYGMGFIMCEPVVIVFLVNSLGASYKESATGLFIIPPLMTMLAFPFWGRLIDRFGAILTAAFAYGILILWALSMVAIAIVANIPEIKHYAMWIFYLSYAVKGVAMSGIDIVWNLGALEFAGKTKPGQKGQPGAVRRFMSVHVFVAGLRGLVAPTLGVSLLVLFGAYASFGVASMFFVAACLLMLRLNSQARKLRDEASAAN